MKVVDVCHTKARVWPDSGDPVVARCFAHWPLVHLLETFDKGVVGRFVVCVGCFCTHMNWLQSLFFLVPITSTDEVRFTMRDCGRGGGEIHHTNWGARFTTPTCEARFTTPTGESDSPLQLGGGRFTTPTGGGGADSPHHLVEPDPPHQLVGPELPHQLVHRGFRPTELLGRGHIHWEPPTLLPPRMENPHVSSITHEIPAPILPPGGLCRNLTMVSVWR